MNKSTVISAYAAYSLNLSERLASSSGGIFSLLAKKVLLGCGVIYGVAMSADCRRAEFIRVSEEAELEKLRTSKYMQAHVGNTLRQVKEDLENGLEVFFTGTCCQINALLGFLSMGKDVSTVKEKYPNLSCVDVICHGVPSPALWRQYVGYVEEQNRARLVSVNFRCKDNSWVDFCMKEIDDSHKELYVPKNMDPFMIMFLSDYCLRPSCYECIVKKRKLSDLTLADFWGIENVAPEMTDRKGTSLILVRTEKGKGLLDKIREEIKMKEVSYEDGVKYNPAEYRSAVRPVQRDTFFDDMYHMAFEELKMKYGTPAPISIKRKIKLGVKKILIKAGLCEGGGITMASPMGYCLCFTLKERGRIGNN